MIIIPADAAAARWIATLCDANLKEFGLETFGIQKGLQFVSIVYSPLFMVNSNRSKKREKKSSPNAWSVLNALLQSERFGGERLEAAAWEATGYFVRPSEVNETAKTDCMSGSGERSTSLDPH